MKKIILKSLLLSFIIFIIGCNNKDKTGAGSGNVLPSTPPSKDSQESKDFLNSIKGKSAKYDGSPAGQGVVTFDSNGNLTDGNRSETFIGVSGGYAIYSFDYDVLSSGFIVKEYQAFKLNGNKLSLYEASNNYEVGKKEKWLEQNHNNGQGLKPDADRNSYPKMQISDININEVSTTLTIQ